MTKRFINYALLCILLLAATHTGLYAQPLIPMHALSLSPVRRVKLAFTGDLMVHDRQLESAYQKTTGTYTFASFEAITDYLKDADYTVGNLETTFAGKEAGYAAYPLFNSPDSFADAIRDAGYDFVSTANNHCLDTREKGLLRTLDILDARGIGHAGTYRSQADADKTFIQEINSIRFAFLSFTYGTNGIPVPEDKPWLVSRLDADFARRRIEQARDDGADIIIALPHMGVEYASKPSRPFIDWAHNLCEWGADAVMASHPHVLQPVEFYKVTDADGSVRTCFIAYSMGNFISSQRTVPRDAGALFYLEYVRIKNGPVRLINVSFVPTWVQFINAHGRYDIRTLPVYDALTGTDAWFAHGITTGFALREQDKTRLRIVHRETTAILLGKPMLLADIQPIYSLMRLR